MEVKIKYKEKDFYLGISDAVFKEIFLKEKNEDLLEALLKTSLKMHFYKMLPLNIERLEGNVFVRRKSLDILLETDIGLVGIELNASMHEYIRPRNFAFFGDMYSHYVEKGEEYEEITQFIQLNLTSGIKGDPKEFRDYHMQDEEGIQFVSNAFIREINIDRLLEFWYDKNEKKIKEYQYIIMLGLGPEEIERMYSITKDRLVKKYMEEVKRVNEDPRFREYMTKEEDQKKILKSLITEATEEGRAEGEKIGEAKGEQQKAIEIAKNMLEMGIEKETIVKATGLTEEEISKVKEESN